MSDNQTFEVEVEVKPGIVRYKKVELNMAEASTAGLGAVPAAVDAYVTEVESGNGVIHQTLLTLTDLPQAVVNGVEHQGTKIYDFPAGRILVLGVTATIAQKTTSEIATTLNSGATGALALGTEASASTTLNSTAADLMPSTAFASSTVVDVAGTAVSSALAASAHFDGTATAKDVYINTAYATTLEVDGDATQTLSGTVLLTWINLGDY